MIGRKFWILVTAFTALDLLLASCAPTATPAATPQPVAPAATIALASPTTPGTPGGLKPAGPIPTSKPAGAQPKYGGILTVSIYADMPSLDPHQDSNFTVVTLAQPAMNGLIEFDPSDPNWQIRPGLAERWETSKDGTKLTLYLLKDVKWHDGKPFTSADAKFSLDRAGVNPAKGIILPRGKAFEVVEKIETPDDYTLVLTLKYPSAELMDLLAAGSHLMLPKHVVEPLGSAKIRKVEQAVGTGPFKAKSYDSGVGWELVKNPAYFRKGLPYLDGIRYYVVKDESTRFSAFRTKRVLMDAKSPGFSPAQKETLEKSPEAAQVVFTGGIVNSIWGVWMNTRHPGPIGDTRVRKAFHLAIDRQKIQKLFAQTQAPGVLGTVIFPTSKFAIPLEQIEKMPGFRQPKDADIAEAKRLLEEAKLPKDFTVPLVTREGAINRDMTTIVAEELKNLGVGATVKILDTASYYDVQQKKDFVASPYVYGSWSPSPHFSFGDRFVTEGGKNYEGVSDVRIDSLFAKQERSLDTEERKKLFWEIERIVREEIVPVVPLFWGTKYAAQWKEVKGYAGLGLGYYEGNRMEDVWLDR